MKPKKHLEVLIVMAAPAKPPARKSRKKPLPPFMAPKKGMGPMKPPAPTRKNKKKGPQPTVTPKDNPFLGY